MRPIIFLLLYGARAQILVWGDLVFVDNCQPDPCNLLGICRNDSLLEGLALCDCYLGHNGTYCENKLTGCQDDSGTECETAGHGTCLYNDPMSGQDEFSCYCDYGWEQADSSEHPMGACSERTDENLCDVYDCGGHGECDLDDDGNPSCTCHMGWGGDTCAFLNKDVLPLYLLDMVTALQDLIPDALETIARDCSYVWPMMWTDTPMAGSFGDFTEHPELAMCRCLRVYRELYDEEGGYEFSTSYEAIKLARLDFKYSWTVETLYKKHCRDAAVDEDTVVAFHDALADSSDDCGLALNEGQAPLYLRNQAECTCLLSVGDQETAEEVLIYPLHIEDPVSSAMEQWTRCNEAGVCDFWSIWNEIETYATVRPSIYKTCGAALWSLAKSEPSTPTEGHEELFCSCFDMLVSYCPECATAWFGCYAQSKDHLTVFHTYTAVCYDPQVRYRAWTRTMLQWAFTYGKEDYLAMSSLVTGVIQALNFARVTGYGTDHRTMELFCYAATMIHKLDDDQVTNFLLAMSEGAPDGVQLDSDDCVYLDGWTSHNPTGSPITTVESDTASSSMDQDQNILITLCVLVGLNALWLLGRCCTSPTRSKDYQNFDQNDRMANNDVHNRIKSKLSESNDYETTGTKLGATV